MLVPPFATYGYGFANLPFHMLPMDFSLMGMVHSHPSGNKSASDVDFNHFYGRIMMIVGYPYETEQDVVVYNCYGEKLAGSSNCLICAILCICQLECFDEFYGKFVCVFFCASMILSTALLRK